MAVKPLDTKVLTEKEEEKMLATLEIKETDLQKLRRIAQSQKKSVAEFLHDWLESQEITQSDTKETGKWAKVADEMANLDISHETSLHILKTIKEFRDDEGV